MKLKMGNKTVEVASLEQASKVFQDMRDEYECETGKTYHRFGLIVGTDFHISYNGRVWQGDYKSNNNKLIAEAA
jgi:hypothetical protein